MKILQKKFSVPNGWEVVRDDGFDHHLCTIVFAFGSRHLLSDDSVYASLRNEFPAAEIIMNSTSGEIINTQVNDESISLTAILFERTVVRAAAVGIEKAGESFSAGQAVTRRLEHAGLKHVLIISDGLKINGSELVRGIREPLPDVSITGGLAGDGARFKRTLVGLNEQPAEGRVVAIGFYGDHISTSYGSVGGWGPFGPERLITRSKGNVLYELDGSPALSIYKNYLGEYARELPLSGLFFPLSIRYAGSESCVVRALFDVNEEDNSVTFGANIPEGAYARLMRSNFNRLIEGASDAANNSMTGQMQEPCLAILVSCVGRKLVLNQRVEEEIEVIRSIYGSTTAITGFYSYGEISPLLNSLTCELHNQTMTITTFTEHIS